MFNRRRHTPKPKTEAELDITSFMNLMIILVPVLLMSMVFARITVLDIQLPKSASAEASEEEPPRQLELVLREDYLRVNFPAGAPLRTIEHQENGEPDFAALAKLLKDVKVELENQGIEKDDIVILSEPDTAYQTLVSAMDTVRSFKAVVAASEVDAELFPRISLGDAPALEEAP